MLGYPFLVSSTPTVPSTEPPYVSLSSFGRVPLTRPPQVNLVPYFSGELASTNSGGAAGESVNFLDGGGAAPLLLNMPAEDNTSKQ